MQDIYSCLAIDMGAGSIRIVQGIFGEKLILKELYRFDNLIEESDGHERWNLKKIEKEIVRGLEMALDESSVPVHSVGVDSWGVDFVLLDNEGHAMEDPVAYRDRRTEGMKEQWEKLMTQQETFRRTGINYNIFNTLYQLQSMKGQQQINNASALLFMADYINYLLSGKKCNELTLSSTSQLLGVDKAGWDRDILTKLGVEKLFKLPLVREGSLLGSYGVTGYEPLQVYAVAGHDTACAVHAIPYEDENFAFIATGTWCIAGFLSDVPLSGAAAFEQGITNERATQGRFRPLKNLMGLWLIQRLRQDFGNRHSYAEIDELAAAAAPDGVLIDSNDPVFYNPESMKEAIDEWLVARGLELPGDEAAYYRCVYESLARSFRNEIEALEYLRGRSFSCIHLTGGGSQSQLLCQLTANDVQRKVLAGPTEGAATGNLMIQAEAAGFFRNSQEARAYVSRSLNVSTWLPA
jgi:sugar (pentulose or hexulose) kinase